MRKLRWWWGSVQSLRAHVNLYRIMDKARKDAGVPFSGKAAEQLKQQKAMIGHCLLHVLLYYPVGSGRFLPDDDE